ncbi:hypothetical protein E0W68_07215 [Flavobacterium salilacus subsp. salilacus]|uniref:hypothetical protein n=1 Tax=Flavobacterium TaxID=237 RepID=UPI0010750987|nr:MULTISPECIES: hypothetical protein [Flavobacterium]KAF2519039.1 hypothetical protein E0W68_07215 [Flavobacterium salilacus subsp. salilacus]MBE1614796.1 hypothetical protein [Flavobacterium sp. SaA2.13]
MNNQPNVILYCICAFLIILVSSCASFSDEEFKNDYKKIEAGNLSQLSGKYALYSVDSTRQVIAYNLILNEIIFTPSALDVVDNYEIHLEVKNEKEILVQLFNGTKIINQSIVSGELKNGMFYLDNKFRECHGVPYIFGGCRKNKRRLALSKDNSLIVNEAGNSSGAIMIILGDSHSYNISPKFLRKG